MKTFQRRSSAAFIPRYDENGALQLIVASSVTFIAFHLARVTMYILQVEKHDVFRRLFPNFALSSEVSFGHKWWTILTYGWVHEGFFDWFTNMIWLYCFAGVLQSIAGYKQVIPLFVYSLIAGGLFYVTAQYLPFPGLHAVPDYYFFGAQAGVMAFAAAALTMAPSYQLTLGSHLKIPLALIVGAYILLNIISYVPVHMDVLVICLGGIVAGTVFALLLKIGLRPAEWVYDIFTYLQKMATPDDTKLREQKSTKRMEILRDMYEPKHGISQQRIDAILDKINEHGYHSLSRQEKEILNKAGKE